jgi:hypothetical protein
MALLDDIKAQARDAAQRQASAREEARLEGARFRSRAQPAMLRAYHYLRELVDSLAAADPDIRRDYRVEGVGRLRGLRQHDYALAADEVPDVASMTLSFVCSRDEVVRFRVRTRQAVQRQREYLWRHGLLFTFREDLGSTASQDYVGSFEMDAHVRVAVVLQIDEDARRIRMTARNLQHLGEESYLLEVERFDERFLEELGKAVVRRPNRLDELTGFKVPDEVRERLRERIEREAAEKGRELGIRPVGRAEPGRGLLGSLFRRR